MTNSYSTSQPIVFFDKSEEDLENFLFESRGVPSLSLSSFDEVSNDALFFEDKNDLVTDESAEIEKPCWVDEEDEVDLLSRNKYKKLRVAEDEKIIKTTDYEKRLKGHYEKIFKTNWASNKDEGFITSLKSSSILKNSSSSSSIKPDSIQMARTKDANWNEYSQSIVNSVNWHQSGQVLLTAGLDKTLRLFQIDGKENDKISSIYFKDLPIYSAAFANSEIIISGKRKFFYSVDTESSKVTKIPFIRGRDEQSWCKFKTSPDGTLICFRGMNGEMVLVSNKTKQLVGCLKMNGIVSDFDFNPVGSGLYSCGSDGEIYQWDLRKMSCYNRFIDQGARNTHCIAIAENYMATGDESGIVNLYTENSSFNKSIECSPSFLKQIDNITTSIQQLSFSHDGQVLAVCSRVKRDQVKLVHSQTGRVFSNWPNISTKIGHVQCIEFSPNSGYLAIGNDKGRVLLYRCGSYERV